MAFRWRQHPATCAVCETPASEGAIEARGKLFRSNLCLRKYEGDAGRRSKKNRETP